MAAINLVKEWYHNYITLSEVHKYSVMLDIDRLVYKPLISIIVPVYNTKSVWLYQCFASVFNQIYTNWELCICDNGCDPEISDILQGFSRLNKVKYISCTDNMEGANGTNLALLLASGDYVVLLDSDDVLTEDALYRIVCGINKFPFSEVFYTDEMITDVDLVPVIPFFKPEYDPSLLCLIPYFGHLSIYKTSLIKELRLRQCGGSYDYDLALRASLIPGISIVHLPIMIYQYRTYLESTSSKTLQICREGGLYALQDYLNSSQRGSVASINGRLYQVLLATGELLNVKANVSAYKDYPVEYDHIMQHFYSELL